MGRRRPGSPGRRGDGGVSLLLCLGFGYTAQHYAALYGARYDRIAGTTRSEANAAALAARQFGGRSVEMIVLDGASAAPASGLAEAIAAATSILVSISPDDGVDPVL